MVKKDKAVSNDKNAKSRIPHFNSIEEEAEFWDTHDSTEFEDEWEEVTEDFLAAGENIGRG